MSLISHYKLLDIKDILQLLKEICIQLENENIKMDLTIIGGATMLYYFPNHITHRTQDIDAIFNNQELIQRNADAIRESWKDNNRGMLSKYWINNEVVVSDNVLPHYCNLNRHLWDQSTKNVKIYFVSKECLLASKAMAVVERQQTKDIDDFKALCNELKIDNIDKILNIFHKYWSDKQLLNIEFNKNKFIKIWSEVLDIK